MSNIYNYYDTQKHTLLMAGGVRRGRRELKGLIDEGGRREV